MYEGRVVAVAEYIPYRTFWEKIRIVRENLDQGKYVEDWNTGIYVYKEEFSRRDCNGRRKKRNVTMSN